MKFTNILLSLACSAMLLGSAACTDEVEYTPAEASPVTKYYFPTTNSLNVDILDGSNKFVVTVARADSKGEETVAIKSSVTPDNPFTIPESVTFEDGKGTTTLVISYVLTDLVVDQLYDINLELEGIANTPYSWGSMTVQALYLPWRDFEEDESMGIYREDLMTTLLNTGNIKYAVKIQKHPKNDNIFRIVNPYGPSNPYTAGGAFTYDDSKDYYMVINCEDPDGVYFSMQWSGASFNQEGYGEFYATSAAYYDLQSGKTLDEVKEKGECGTYNAKKGVITMPERSALITFEGMVPSLYYGNLDGMFKVVLPGFEDEPEWDEVGWCDFTDGLLSPLFGELGEDGTGNKYKVYVERYRIDKNFYRIVNPWGPESGLTDEAPAQPYYLEFSIEDPEFVTIGEVEPDFTIGDNGLVVTDIATFMMNYMDKTLDEVQAAGFGGTFEDKVFRLAGDQAVYMMYSLTTGKITNYGQYEEDYQIETVLDLNTAVKSETEDENKTESVKPNFNNIRTRFLPRSVNTDYLIQK